MHHGLHHHRPRRGPRILPLLMLGGAFYALTRLVVGAEQTHASGSGQPRRDKWGRSNRELQDNARKALAMKRAAEADKPQHPVTQTAHEGMRSLPNQDIAPSGALEAEGFRPAFERGGRARRAGQLAAANSPSRLAAHPSSRAALPILRSASL